jgi:predicted RNA methylase
MNNDDDDDDNLRRRREMSVRSIARQKLGYFPLSSSEANRIRGFLLFSGTETSVLDPCSGTGAALASVTSGARAIRSAIELDAFRAEEAAKAVDQLVQGNCFDVHCAVESFSLLLLNPPLSERFFPYV